MKVYLLTCGLAAALVGCSGIDNGYPPPQGGPGGNRPGQAQTPSSTSWQQYNRGSPTAYRAPVEPMQPSLNGTPQAGAVASGSPAPYGSDPLHSGQRTPYGAWTPNTPSSQPTLLPDAVAKDVPASPVPEPNIRRTAYEQDPSSVPPLRVVPPETLPPQTDRVVTTAPAPVPGAPQPLLMAAPDMPTKPASDPLLVPSGPNAPAPVVSEPAPAQTPPQTTAVVPMASEEKDPMGAPIVGKPEDKPASSGSPPVRMVNSKRIVLNYELKDVGPSGVSLVELWMTRDGRSWKKDETTGRSGPPYVVEVQGEGMYGFTLVARNGVGLGKEPPKSGDLPQVWVEVDLTRPTVNLLDVKNGNGAKAREVTIQWEAFDRNLARRPVSLSYAASAEGPWSPIASNIENSGHYVWQMPSNGPLTFYIRVEAADMVGNVGVAQASKPLSIDTTQPTVSILGVEPGDK